MMKHWLLAVLMLAVVAVVSGCASMREHHSSNGGVQDVKVGGSMQIRGNYYR